MNAVSALLVVLIFTQIASAAGPSIDSHTTHLAILKLALVCVAIVLYVRSMAAHFVLIPISFINVTVAPCHSSCSLFFIFDIVAFISQAIAPDFFAPAMNETISPLAGYLIPILAS